MLISLKDCVVCVLSDTKATVRSDADSKRDNENKKRGNEGRSSFDSEGESD